MVKQTYVAVRFLMPFAMYNPGEIATFPQPRAEAIVAGKVAEMVAKPASKAKPKAAKPVTKAAAKPESETPDPLG